MGPCARAAVDTVSQTMPRCTASTADVARCSTAQLQDILDHWDAKLEEWGQADLAFSELARLLA